LIGVTRIGFGATSTQISVSASQYSSRWVRVEGGNEIASNTDMSNIDTVALVVGWRSTGGSNGAQVDVRGAVFAQAMPTTGF